ncbi:MAG: GNAT family N-acetyltransferase [Paracoccaceae bacterium]
MITVRPYRPQDRAAITGVYYRAVREGAAGVYSEEQRRDWAKSPVPDLSTPDPRAGQDCWVSEEAGRITGFMALDRTGYLDMAFCLPEVMGRGHALAIYRVLELHARAAGLTRLTVHASHYSRRFLEKQGWTLDGTEDFVSTGGVHYERFLMSRDLA